MELRSSCCATNLQVVAVKGINPSGSCILVKQLWSHLPPPSAHKQQQQQQEGSAGAAAMEIDSMAGTGLGSSAGLSAVVAAGPFCLAEDLSYEPLQDMLQELKGKPPNMLVSAAVQLCQAASPRRTDAGLSALCYATLCIVGHGVRSQID